MSLQYAGRARRILTADEPALRKIAKPVSAKELRDPLFSQLIDDMFATVTAQDLIGMAASQIGVIKQLFVIYFKEAGETYGPLVMINPTIEMSEGEFMSREGSPCISGIVADVPRATNVICSGLDRHGKKQCIDATGLLAICIQHEMDHLVGKLITDRAIAVNAITEDERQIGGLG